MLVQSAGSKSSDVMELLPPAEDVQDWAIHAHTMRIGEKAGREEDM